ncbi:GTP-binding protein [Thermococcus profundus]|uniref:Probable GTP-binding protein EngB n=1 Tax=Thermococcus profundus TaxID=49899 RepID=A0A2Z2MFN0_THEPR|nr:GTP-binding protein EngB [Thermococcus profundus]ASJ02704.1 GTP-binding protein [Thermococcus profundus]
MIIFVGRSNVGKSTLIHRLTGKEVRRGKRPGVTRRPIEINWRGKRVIDMPGFGFMSGVPKRVQERVKDEIVHFIEDHAEEIELAVLVIDGKAAPEIIERWENRGEIPIDVEFFQFLRELEIPTLVALNKVDRVRNVEGTVNFLAEKFGITHTEARRIIIPISAKFGRNIETLRRAISETLEKGKKASENLENDVGDGLSDPVE